MDRVGDLGSRACLVSLSLSQWTARKLDKQATQHVANHYGNATSAGNYSKKLMPADAQSYLAIATAATEARSYHYANTLPWKDDGARVLPADNFMAYAEGMRSFRAKFEKAVAEFLYEYPRLVEESRVILNGLWKEQDFPSVSQLAKKFRFETGTLPFPTAADFRVDLAGGAADAVRAEIERDVRRAAEEAMGDAWDRLREALGKMQERLAQPDAIFRDTLFDNLAELCDILPRLNLLGDTRLDRMTADIKAKVLTCTPQEARDDKPRRAALAQEVENLGALMDGFLQ